MVRAGEQRSGQHGRLARSARSRRTRTQAMGSGAALENETISPVSTVAASNVGGVHEQARASAAACSEASSVPRFGRR